MSANEFGTENSIMTFTSKKKIKKLRYMQIAD